MHYELIANEGIIIIYDDDIIILNKSYYIIVEFSTEVYKVGT